MERATPCGLDKPHPGEISRRSDRPLPKPDAPEEEAAEGSSLARLLGAARTGDYRRGMYVFTAFLAVVALLLNLRGPCLQLAFGHDSIGFLNSAWKVRCGVFPHADYHSALGALNPWMLAAGMWVLGPTAEVLPLCYTVFGVVLGWLAYVVARPRLPAVPTVLFAATQTVVAISPHLLRFKWTAATYDGCYNRQGYALVSILLLLLFLPTRPGQARRESWEGRIAGAILGVLLFLKISYFMAGGGLCVLACLCARRWSRAWCGNLLAAGLVVAAACLPLIRFDVLALWRDLHLAALVRLDNPEETSSVGRYLGWMQDAWVEMALLAIMQLLLRPPWFVRRPPARPYDPRSVVPAWAELAGVVGASAFICMTNTAAGTLSETPLLTSWLFVLLGCALWEPADTALPATTVRLRRNLPVMCGLSCVLWTLTFSHSFLSLVWSASPWQTPWRRDALNVAHPFDADSLRELHMVGWAGESPMPQTYAGKVNDGLRMLRALGGTHRVEAFDFVNPFPFALQWPASHGGMWCWHTGYSFSAAYHPEPEEAFGDVDVLMYPKHPGHPKSFATMVSVYGAYVDAHFEGVAKSDEWTVLRRKSVRGQ